MPYKISCICGSSEIPLVSLLWLVIHALDSIADHGRADRPLVAPDLGLEQPPDADLGDRAGGERGEQEGGLLHQEQVQEHARKAERHQDLRRTENTSGVSWS